MRLILVRHGQTDSNVNYLMDTGVPGAQLDATGRAQAEQLVGRLAAYDIDAVYASNLTRTQQTARPLAEHRGLAVQVLPGLREVSAGAYEMSSEYLPYTTMLRVWATGNLDVKVPDGEDGYEFFARYDAAVASIAAAGAQVAMLVSHGAALRTWASARIAGFDAAASDAHLDNTSVIVADGSPQEGWTLAILDGLMYYPDQLAVEEG